MCKYDMPPQEVHRWRRWLLYEKPIVALLQQGVSTDAIAETLNISIRTVFRTKNKAKRYGISLDSLEIKSGAV